MAQSFASAEAITERIIADVGKTIVLGLPLGLGKANHITNALYARAAADRSIKLTIFTALTLEKPRPSSTLERRFINPVIERLFGGYPELAYAKALHAGALPPNIEVNEFFFLAGRWLNSPMAQQNYISANYTHAFNYLLSRGVNVVAQLVAKRGPRYSLSCNTDITVDLLKVRRAGGTAFRLYGQVNAELPFMAGDGDIGESEFAGVLEGSDVEFPLFAPPAEPISDRKYAIGLHVVEDDPSFGMIMAAYLDVAGYETTRVMHGREVFGRLERGRYDTVLLDLNLPDEDGLAIMRSLRARSDVPIVIVTARHGTDDRLAALEMGADDYLIKPFEPRELVARVRNIIRRYRGTDRKKSLFRFARWELDVDRHALRNGNGQSIALTPAEFDLLLALVKNRGHVMSRAQLIDAIVHTEPPESERAVDVLMSRLRKKIEKDADDPQILLTIRGHGYRLADSERG